MRTARTCSGRSGGGVLRVIIDWKAGVGTALLLPVSLPVRAVARSSLPLGSNAARGCRVFDLKDGHIAEDSRLL